MQVYELGYLILPSIPEDGLSGIVDKIKNLITKKNGNVFAGENPIKIDLAYTMSKTVGSSRYVVNDAYIGWLKFETESENIEEIKSKTDSMSEVLRSLIIKAPKESSFTFAQARQKLEAKEDEKIEDAEEVASAETLENNI